MDCCDLAGDRLRKVGGDEQELHPPIGMRSREVETSRDKSRRLDRDSEADLPVIFGVITTETIEQAIERAGTKMGNKGFEAAATAIEMASLMEQITVSKGSQASAAPR